MFIPITYKDGTIGSVNTDYIVLIGMSRDNKVFLTIRGSGSSIVIQESWNEIHTLLQNVGDLSSLFEIPYDSTNKYEFRES